MPAALPAAPMPLFDRLCSDDETADGAVLDARGLRQSLAGELSRLLNTRSRLGLAEYADKAATVLDYGLPDFSALSARSADDLAALRDAIAHAIRLFEPRLMHAEVTLTDDPASPQRARVHIDAAVRLGHELRRVRFDLDAEPGTASIGAA
ncbi:type VI secretion system baseplate subunit TssE [Derxia gummosa]|uniref:Type VI secretion system baseplate subunit TssE n=1 Tax=Derxia gummosa DSM 723 TaxID=1121388 RepID=A0A8B6X3V4_9BURK|nr:type VI secretion system baseplate subunit TssE [Derxia gummosa]